MKQWVLGVGVLALALCLVGCGGDTKKGGEPKVDSNAPKFEQKTPGGGAGSKGKAGPDKAGAGSE